MSADTAALLGSLACFWGIAGLVYCWVWWFAIGELVNDRAEM